MKLLYNEEELTCTKTELLNFKIAKLYMVASRLASNCSIFSNDNLVNIQLVTFLFYCYPIFVN